MASIEVGAVVDGRFALEAKIGQGGMGSVWKARDQSLDTVCAVKFMDPELLMHAQARDEALERFKREAQAAAKLASPHVVNILQHGVWSEIPYIAMEYLVGEDLGKRLQKRGRIPPRELFGIFEQVLRALHKAHALGIVHRDLKPDNIYLVHDEDREIAKVLDFGIAKHASDALQGSKTRTGAMLGTPYYMSPEQAQGLKAVDGRSDLWSLAVIVFQCVTGKLPFESDALGDLIVRIVVGPIPVPSHLGPVPPGFDAWFMKATQRDPALRFQTAKEFIQSLGMALGVTGVGNMRPFSGASLVDASEVGGGGTVGPHFGTGPGVGPSASNPNFSSGPGFGTGSRPGLPGTTPPPFGAIPSGPSLQSQTGPGIASTFSGAHGATTSRAPLLAGVAVAAVVVLGGAVTLAFVVSRPRPMEPPVVASASAGPYDDSRAATVGTGTVTPDPPLLPSSPSASPGDSAPSGASASAPVLAGNAAPVPGSGSRSMRGPAALPSAKALASSAPSASVRKPHPGGPDPTLGF